MIRGKKKTIIVAGISVLALAASTLLSGCGNASAATAQAAQSDGTKTIIVATGGSPKPHTYVNEKGELTGYDIAVLKAVDKRLPQYQFEYRKVSFDGLLTGLDSDRYQIAANSYSITPERAEKYEYSVPYFHENYGIVTKEGNAPIKHLKDLSGKTTLTSPGTAIAAQLESLNKDQLKDNPIKINYTQGDITVIYKSLEEGQSDFLFGSQSNYHTFTKALDINPTFTALPDDESALLGNSDNVFLYSKTDEGKALKKTIDKAIEQLNGDGTLTKVSKQFFDGLDFAPKQ
ncbi:transporter substrate-binding domain-containing protein [Bifidobacterium sp. MA2]|uniref:Transporter substrate-binding domain-containing protein n=1 Tax=Bifidobacterium santillanense TaxID=2809028 RepID=A0ABS5UNF0_9BIFI|nr:transporter substrate-binding domain-containing protein [Bifidobacterium santillanense]MBT1172434.1 transporter substrate-binding domain-containing protein [Bifidobacterium santillanense]